MIEVTGLSKRYGDRTAVDNLSFTVQPGVVTGFLGPNGAGKSTTMRLILGLDRPSAGQVRINGRRYLDHTAPLAEIGALIEARGVHPGRSAYHHLLALGATNGIGKRRVHEVIDLVGLHDVARQAAGNFSLGMGQRLGIASALLGDPRTIMLDEPANGLDPEGILWIRNLLKDLANEGRTVFVSSHLMSEMALTAEQLVVIGRGRLIADVSVAEFTRQASSNSVRVRSPQADQLTGVLLTTGVQVTSSGSGALRVTGLSTDEIGQRAAAAGLTLLELAAHEASLEEAFMELTGDAVEYHASTPRHTGKPGHLEPGSPASDQSTDNAARELASTGRTMR